VNVYHRNTRYQYVAVDISVGNAMVSCAFVACNMPAIIGAYYMQKLYATIEYVYSPKKAEIAHTHTHNKSENNEEKSHTTTHTIKKTKIRFIYCWNRAVQLQIQLMNNCT